VVVRRSMSSSVWGSSPAQRRANILIVEL
jgi:hypothetical protein